MGKVMAVCLSKARGTQKENAGFAHLAAGWGLEGDAHAGAWHRQVSLLSAEKIAAFNEKGAGVEAGAFGENLVVSGIDLAALEPGTRLRCGSALLELTQIGKECHAHCAIYRRMGDCIMPREGVFARVLQAGDVRTGDEVTVLPQKGARPLRAAVITLSDKGARGERADTSGPAIEKRLRAEGYDVEERLLLPDGMEPLTGALFDLCDRRRVDLILTTGGTGFSPRDVTPEATLAVAERNAPGIAEAIRAGSMRFTPRAMLSRGVSVIRRRTLIVNLPGSEKACMESMDIFMEVLPHALALLRGEDGECGRH